MRTPAEETEFQQLGTQLGFFSPPAPPQESTGFMGFAGQHLANIIPEAASHIIQPMQTLLSGSLSTPDQGEIPNFFTPRAPQGLAEKGVAIGSELASYLPAIALTEGATAEGLGAIGFGSRAAKIGGSAAGFAFPSAPEGREAAATQGAAGGLFELAKPLGWRGRIAAGLAAGGIGYYEGQKQSPEQGLLYGALNLAGPTVIDPIVGKLFGHNKAAADANKVTEATSPTPSQPTGNIMDDAFSAMTPGQKQAHLEAVMGRSGPPEPIGPVPNPQQGFFGRPTTGSFENAPNPLMTPAPVPFGVQPETPQVAGLQLAGPQTSASNGGIPFFQIPDAPINARLIHGNWSNPDRGAPVIGMGSHITGDIANVPGQTIYDIFGGSQQKPSTSILSPAEQAVKDSMSIPEEKKAPPTPVKQTVESRIKAPEGSEVPQPTREGAHVIASAVKQGNKILVGSKPNAPHEQIGIEHGITTGDIASSVPEEKRGFLVQNSDGTQGFANRSRATKIAKKAGQIPQDSPALLKSESPWMGEPQFTKPNLAEPSVAGPMKAGDSAVHWNEQGMPLDVMVKKVEDGIIHYTEHDFMTGQVNDKVATLQEFQNLEKMPDERPRPKTTANLPEADYSGVFPKPEVTPVESVESILAARKAAGHPMEGLTEKKIQEKEINNQVRVRGKYGQWDPATIVSREGKTLHVEIDDPVFGKRQTSVLESDTLPMETSKPTEGKGTVPFQDVPGAKLRKDVGESFFGEGDVRGTVVKNEEIGRIIKTLPGREKTVLSVKEGLKMLPPEAASIIGRVIASVQHALGHEIDTYLGRAMPGVKGAMHEMSGRVGLNLQWINQVVRHWDKMSETSKINSIMRVLSLYSHEVSHVAHLFGEKTNLMIEDKPITKLVMEKLDSFSGIQREYIQSQIKAAKGDLSGPVSKYLSGDLEATFNHYKKGRPGLTIDMAKELAAGEVLAEISSIELAKRLKVEGLPDGLRAAIDKFKQVIVNVVNWFKGRNQPEQVAALQSLSDISNKMFDHFSAADTSALEKAYPAGRLWTTPKDIPLPSGPAAASEAVKPFLTSELARLGVRAAIGGTVGGFVGPTITGHELGTVESVIAGGVLGAFGPAVAKTLLNKAATGELIAAAKALKGGPFAALQVLTGGKSLRELGAEARYGLRGDGSAFAKVVRLFESELNINLDPKIKAILEQARGIMGEQFAIVEDALKKSRWIKPSQGALDATEQYIEGKIDKEKYQSLLTDDAGKAYGQFMIAAREATTVGSDMIAAGMRKTQFRDAIINAREKYVGRFYKAYKDGEFDMKYFDKVKQDFMQMNPGIDIHNAEALLREHMVEIKANRRLFGSARGTGAQSFESKIQFRRRATEEEIYMQQLEVASLEHNPHSAEFKAANDKLTWMQEHKVTDNWRGWLGEIKDPTERMIYTFQKIYPSSIAGKIFDLLDNSLDQFGNKFAYSGEELTNARSLLKSEIAKGGTDVASLQTRLKQLEAYTPLPQGAAYGKLSGKFTDRFVRDQISTYDTPYKWMDQSIIRGIAAINQMVKVNRTVLNPLTAIRNYFQLPMFMLMARATPKDVWDAVQVIHKGANPELLSVMRQRHILGVDYAAQELSTNLGAMVSGRLDADLATKIAKQGYAKAHEFYQQPDMLQRGGAFVAAQRRLAERMGLPPMDSRVIDAAVEYTDRFTMNYATVPRAVKALRQLPFASLFISYTSEITKILKNLVVDATNKGVHSDDRMHAIMALGAMAAIPPLLVAGFESNLKPDDLQDWKKLRALQPDYARSRFYLPTSRDEKGNFHYMDMTALIPADNYTQMIKAAIQGDHQAFVASNPFVSLQDTPLLNIATEQISGKDLRTGQSVQDFGRVKEVMKELLPPILPPGYEGTRIVNAFSPNALGEQGLTNLRTGLETKPSDIIANYLTAIRMGTTNLATVQKSAMMEAQQQIAHEKQLMNDTVRMNVPNQTRIEAYNRYQKSVMEIMAQMQEKMK